MLTGIECPYCNQQMRLTMGNPAFIYWECKNCNKEFEYNAILEKFNSECDIHKDKLLEGDKTMKPINYTCRHCGTTNTITAIWRWFWTPHMGSKKLIKCEYCGKRHFMTRQNYKYKWLDWYK